MYLIINEYTHVLFTTMYMAVYNTQVYEIHSLMLMDRYSSFILIIINNHTTFVQDYWYTTLHIYY